MTDVLLDGFGGLDGIDDARKVQARDSSALEILVKVAEEVLKGDIISLTNALTGTVIDLNYMMSQIEGNDPFSQLYKTLPAQLSNVQFTENDIESFIFSTMDKERSEQEQIVLGFFTGALAHILTEKNRAHGKRTRIYINGNGKRFDYLFYCARNVDEIIVQNLTGITICGRIQNANRLIGVSLNGGSIFSECGTSIYETNNHCSKIGEIIALGINGASNLSLLGNFEQLIAIGMLGNKSLTELKSGCLKKVFAVDLGNIDLRCSSPKYNTCCDIMLFGVHHYDFTSGFIHSGIQSQNVFVYQNLPLPVGVKLYQIIYNGSAEEYQSHKDAFGADKLSAHLKDKSQYEIIKIVDDITRYETQLSQQLSMR